MCFGEKRVTSFHISAGFFSCLVLYLIRLDYSMDYTKRIDTFQWPAGRQFLWALNQIALTR
jgi:hypothetical protein